MKGCRAGDLVRVEFPFEIRGKQLTKRGRVIQILAGRQARVIFTDGNLLDGCSIEQAVVTALSALAPVADPAPRSDAFNEFSGAFEVRQLFSRQGEAIIAIDRYDRIQFWDEGAEALYGWTAGEALGEPLAELIVPEISIPHGLAIMREVTAGHIWAGEFAVHRRDGSEFIARVVDYPVIGSDRTLLGIIGVSSAVRRPLGELDVGYQVGDPVRVNFPFTARHEPMMSEGVITSALSDGLFRVVFPRPRELDGCAIEQALVHEDRFT